MTSPTPTLYRLWRGLRIALHLIKGLLIVGLVFPFSKLESRRRIRQRWSAQLLRCFNFHLEIEGLLPENPGLIAANHVSWLDVFAINALHPVAFVSKDDVLGWPLIGTLARTNETLFLRRGSRGHAHSIGGEMCRCLQTGDWLAVFPEGTTTDGSQLHPFHGALLQPAITTGVGVTPLALRYEDSTGNISPLPAYAGDTTLWQSVCAMLSARQLTVRLIIGEPIMADAADCTNQARKNLARNLHAQIHAALYTNADLA